MIREKLREEVVTLVADDTSAIGYVSALMQELADSYMKLNPNATIEVVETDSTNGLTGAMSGIYDLGMASRDLKDYEKELLDYKVIAKVADIPILGVCVGTLMTLVVQSSSATIAVLQNFASQAGPDGVSSIIGLAGAIPILLGDNIGTTITALLASVGQSKDAKRTAVAHCIFNLSGAFLFIWIVKPYAYLIQTISPKGNEVDVISRQIANAHTGFNLTMTLIWIPLIAVMVKLVMKIVPDRKGKTQVLPSAPKYLDEKLIGQPVAALHLVAKEVVRCSDLVTEMLLTVKNGKSKEDALTVKEIVEKAQIEHELNENITEYLSAMYSEGVLTEEQAAQSTGIMYVLCDIDRMAMLSKEISENIVSESDKKQKFSKEALKELRKSVNVILELYGEAMSAIITGENALPENVQSRKEEVLLLDEKMRKAHAQRVAKKKCDAKLTIAYNNILHDIDRMGNTCANLIDTALNQVNFRVFLADEGE